LQGTTRADPGVRLSRTGLLSQVESAVEDLNEPVGLNVDRRLGIDLKGAAHVVRRGRGRLAPLRRRLSLVEGCGNTPRGMSDLGNARRSFALGFHREQTC